MANVIPEEGWAKLPKTSVYFCGVLADAPGGPEGDRISAALRHEEVRDNAIAFLRREVCHLWPKAFDADGEFRWDLMVDPTGPAYPRRLQRADQ